jgi:hypothetical protein
MRVTEYIEVYAGKIMFSRRPEKFFTQNFSETVQN